MKTFEVNEHEPLKLQAALKAAGVPVVTIRAFGIDRRHPGAALGGIVIVDDKAVDATVLAAIAAHVVTKPATVVLDAPAMTYAKSQLAAAVAVDVVKHEERKQIEEQKQLDALEPVKE